MIEWIIKTPVGHWKGLHKHCCFGYRRSDSQPNAGICRMRVTCLDACSPVTGFDAPPPLHMPKRTLAISCSHVSLA